MGKRLSLLIHFPNRLTTPEYTLQNALVRTVTVLFAYISIDLWDSEGA